MIFHPKRTQPNAGQESVWDYPRPPRLERVSERLRITFNSETIANTTGGYRILETSHPPVYYIPPENIASQFLTAAPGSSWCEFKGQASYWSLDVKGKSSANAAWSYRQPSAAYAPIARYLAFYASRVDSCWVGEERVQPQEGDFYGGWITSRIVGPFKGGRWNTRMVDRSNPSSTVWAPDVGEAATRDLCTDCGVSRSSEPKRCGYACQFIKPDYDAMERRVHGRARDANRPDEMFFGPFRRMIRASMRQPRDGAQWTGIATRIGERLLETGAVDAVLTMAPDPIDKWKPVPVLVTSAKDMAQCRGMRMGYAPLLALLEPAQARGFKRLAVIGIPCQVYALRALEKTLGFERLLVVGTPCSDNTTTANFHRFLDLLSDDPDSITYLEFRADYHVELRFRDGSTKEIPFLQLPISKLPPDFFPMTCRTCVDYTNVLADITVGYMGGQGEQWLLVRNQRGEEMLDLLGDEVRIKMPASAGKRAGPVKGFLKNVERAAGGLPLRSMPNWLRPIVGWLMPRIGPRGLEFARARIEMKAIETVLHLRRQYPQRVKNMVPAHVWALVKPYGVEPGNDERSRGA